MRKNGIYEASLSVNFSRIQVKGQQIPNIVKFTD